MTDSTTNAAAPQPALARSVSQTSSHAAEEWDIVDASSAFADEKTGDENKAPTPSPSGRKADSSSLVDVEAEVDGAQLSSDLSSHVSHPNWLTVASDGDEVAGNSDEKSSEVVDAAFCCSLCQLPISGVRYKCLYCTQPPVHLCAECEDNEKHDVLHPLIKIRRAEQCPDSGTIAKELRESHINVLRPVGVSNGATMEPGESFWAGWALKYSGSSNLRSCRLAFSAGNNLNYSEHEKPARLPPLRPNAQTELMVELKAPNAVGPHRGVFRLRSDKGSVFGPALVVEINVHPRA